MAKLTVRMDDDLHDTVRLIADAEQTTVQAVILGAVQAEVDRVLADQGVRARMRARLRRQQAILEEG